MSDKINISVNGKIFLVEEGVTILEALAKNGIPVPTLCAYKDHSPFGACSLCMVELENNPRLARACSLKVAEGMKIDSESPRVVRARKNALELIMYEHEGDCLPPCMLECPAGVDCQGFIKQIAAGNYMEAVRIIKEKLPLPATIGRVCPAPCEKKCRRALVEEPLSISFLKYFAADAVFSEGKASLPQPVAKSGKKTAIIGGGPAGLTAAYFLALEGHDVTVYDAMPQMGGMLRYGIPEYRLPRDVIDREIAEIASLGVSMKNNIMIGRDISFAEIKATCDAVLVAIGAWRPEPLGCTGEEYALKGIEFLRDVSLGKDSQLRGKRVAVIGGGNTAIDASRTALREGAREVCIIYRRTRRDMPADDVEIEDAMEEQIDFKFLATPDEILHNDGNITGIRLQLMKEGPADGARRAPVPIEGKFETLEFDVVIAAIGQRVLGDGFESLSFNKKGYIAIDSVTGLTPEDRVFAAGDAVEGASGIAIDAVGTGGRAARAINACLSGIDLNRSEALISRMDVSEDDFASVEKAPRAPMPKTEIDSRKMNFNEVNLGFDEKTAHAEARRCLECGCHEYDNCRLIFYANRYVTDQSVWINPKRKLHEKDTSLVCIERNQDKCILCGLCVRTCYEKAGKGIIDFIGRGSNTVIKAEFKSNDAIAGCPDCLKCAGVCPTGALRIIVI